MEEGFFWLTIWNDSVYHGGGGGGGGIWLGVPHISHVLGHKERECGTLYIQHKFPDNEMGASHDQDEYSLPS